MANADTHQPSTPLTAALGYARRGWRVVPIRPGEKRPALAAWQTEGSTDEQRIRHWWGSAPDHGVGIVTGPESGLWVLDIDVAGDKRGDDSLQELLDAYGPLPDTYEVLTGGGGRHLYFRWPAIGSVGTNASRLGPGIDVRGAGGQVVAPPTIHPTGRPYELEASSAPEPADAPGWLLALLDTPEPPRSAATPAPATGDRPGDLWAAATTWAQILEPDGWTLHHVDPTGEEHWTRPGKDRREGSSATVNYLGSDTLKVFTSSVPQLTAYATYSKLGYYAATRHAGDHAAAASALRSAGWHSAPAPELDDLIGSSLRALPPPAEPERPRLNLPDDFWNARPELAHIRQAAHARIRSADAVFAVVLARLAALVPPSMLLPGPGGLTGSLDYMVALIGGSGAGKSSAAQVAGDLIAIPPEEKVAVVSLGSGEGLIEAYLDYVNEEGPDGKVKKEKRQVKRGVLAMLDEGQAMAEMGGRRGSTLMPTLRSAWSGGQLGQANAAEERKRFLPAGAYRFAMVAGFQLEHATGLLDDAAGGTPQRFVYMSAHDPAIPDQLPEWPGGLGWAPWTHQRGPLGLDDTVTAELVARTKAFSRGTIRADPLDSHRDLVRLKTAGLLALLAHRDHIDADDWALAGTVVDTSDTVRASIVSAAATRAQETEQRTRGLLAGRNAHVEDDAAQRAREGMARAIARHVHRGPCEGGCKRRCVTQAPASKHRKLATIDDALELATANGWITERDGVFTKGATCP